MENGKIPDHNISASMSSFDNNWEMFGAHQARLKSSSGFRADPSVVEQTSFHYIKVELPKEMIITAIATQGLGEEWVAKYTLMASQKGEDFVWFRGDNDNITEKVKTKENLLSSLNNSQKCISFFFTHWILKKKTP